VGLRGTNAEEYSGRLTLPLRRRDLQSAKDLRDLAISGLIPFDLEIEVLSVSATRAGTDNRRMVIMLRQHPCSER
jgi:hypothetical protein